jgi:prepilin-type processing-associated H-X9-DG protein
MNNMKQCALAALNFESGKGYLPTAGGTTATEFEGDELNKPGFGFENAAWHFQVLPFLEAGNLHSLRSSLVTSWNEIYQEAIPFFTCASRGESRRLENGGLAVQFTPDYAGVMGTWNLDYIEGGEFPSGGTSWGGFQWRVASSDINPNEEANVWTGLIVKDGHVNYSTGKVTRLARVENPVPDGSSNTIMFMEKSRDSSHYDLIAEDAVDTGYWDGGIARPSDWTCVRGFMLDPPIYPDSFARTPGRGGKVPFEPQFGSPHPGTTNAAMGDGSVRAISNDTPGTLLNSLGTRAGGEVVSDGF